MIWTDDKQKHYKYCFDHTMNAPKILRSIWGICVFIGVSFYKEVINDFLMKKGTFDIQDVHANIIGCMDALNNKESRF